MKSGYQRPGDQRPKRSRQGAADVSVRAFARSLGVSHVAVLKGITAGRLTKSVGRDARKRPVITDPELAAAEWRLSTRTGAGGEADAPGAEIVSTTTLVEAQRQATLERARKLKLENDVTEGRLVDVERVAKEAFEADRIIRESLLNLPARLSGELAAETDAARVQMKLDAAIREALSGVADALLAAVNA